MRAMENTDQIDRSSHGIRKILDRAGIDSIILKPVTAGAIRNTAAGVEKAWTESFSSTSPSRKEGNPS